MSFILPAGEGMFVFFEADALRPQPSGTDAKTEITEQWLHLALSIWLSIQAPANNGTCGAFGQGFRLISREEIAIPALCPLH